MGEELELKYRIRDPRAVQAWLDRQLPAPDGAPGWRSVVVHDRYFDTPDGALEAAGYGARLRECAGRVTVGLKSDIEVRDGLHARREIEAPATLSLVAAEWPPSDARELVSAAAGQRRLTERFSLQQVRREREHVRPGSVCLISVDRVAVRHQGRSVGEFCQLEVELLAGDAADLTEIARSIGTSRLVQRESRSKMAIAASLVATDADGGRGELTEP